MRTLEEIDGELTRLRVQKEETQNKLRELSAERDQVAAKESALRKALNMSPAERAALGIPEPQVVNGAGGIESEESVQG